MITYQILRTLDEYMEIQDEWDTLHSKSDVAEPYQHSSFVRSWIKAGPVPHQPWILEIRQNGVLVAGLALMLKRERFLGVNLKVLVPLGTPLIDYFEPILDRSISTEQVVSMLLEASRDVDAILLENVRESSPMYTSLANSGFNRAHFVNCYRRNVTWDSQADVNEIVIGQTSRRMLRSKYNRLKKLGELRLTQVTEPSEVRDTLLGAFEYHRNRWRGTPTPSMFEQSVYQEYYFELAAQMIAEDRMLLSRLDMNDELLGVHIGLKERGKLIWYTPASNPNYQKHSVGIVLITELAKVLPELGINIFDFSRGDESYKMQFCDIEEENLSMFLDRSLRGKTVMAVRRAARRALHSNDFLRKRLIALVKRERN